MKSCLQIFNKEATLGKTTYLIWGFNSIAWDDLMIYFFTDAGTNKLTLASLVQAGKAAYKARL